MVKKQVKQEFLRFLKLKLSYSDISRKPLLKVRYVVEGKTVYSEDHFFTP